MKKIILIALLCTIATIIFLYQPNNNSLEKAYSLVLNDNILSAEKMLAKLENKTSVWPYFGFIELIKKDDKKAENFFQKALLFPQKKEVIQEIYLGKALIHYINQDFDAMQLSIEKAKNIHFPCPSLFLLDGLYQYEIGELSQASSLFSSYLQKNKNNGSWIEPSLQNYFSKDLIEIYYAHTLIHLNKFAECRSLLEKHALGPYGKMANLFLGYSYLHEAAPVDLNSKLSYLDVALCYFERADCPLNQKIAPEIQKTIEYLLKNEEECFYAFSFIHLLEKWKLKQSLAFSAEKALERIEKCSQLKALSFCHSLKEGFEGGLFHEILLERLVISFQKNLKDKKIKNPFEIWHKIEAVSSQVPEFACNKIASFTEQEILSLLQEEKNLQKSLSFLKFWKSLERDKEANNLFSEKLLNLGMLYWRKENEEQKGTQILKIALHIVSESSKKTALKEVEDFFLALYHQAQSSNMVARLSLIHDAMQEFKIPFKGLLSKDEIANHLADASYYYSVHNFFSAKIHAEWVVKLDPKNQEAARLVGLSSFHLGNYKMAWNYLSKLKNPDIESQEAVMLSERHFSESIAQVDMSNTYETD